MDQLIMEYTDTKGVKHSVEHFTIPTDEKNGNERIVAELVNALTRPSKRAPTERMP